MLIACWEQCTPSYCVWKANGKVLRQVTQTSFGHTAINSLQHAALCSTIFPLYKGRVQEPRVVKKFMQKYFGNIQCHVLRYKTFLTAVTLQLLHG